MRMRWLAVTSVGLSLVTANRGLAQQAAAGAAQETGPVVTEAAVGTGVADRQIQGASETFPATVGSVYCFTKIGKTQAGATIEHVWYHGDQEVARKQLTIGGSPWRTWSSKTIPPEATGDWRVDVVADGKVIKSVSFKVQ
jgi:hypothetical protein